MKDLIVMLAPGYEEIEALTVVDYLRRAGGDVTIAAVEQEELVTSSHEVTVKADALLRHLDPNDYRAIYLPGGLPGATHLADNTSVRAWVSQFHSEGKLVAAICAGPVVLDRLKFLEPGQYTCYPGYEVHLETPGRIDAPVVKNGQIWTAMGPAFAPDLAFALVEELLGSEEKENLAKALLK